MKATLGSRLAVSLMAVAFGLSVASLANAQDSAGATANGTTQAAPTKAEKKAAQKAARQQARAKKNAELKKLEAAGYDPAKRDDATYPQDIQNAQKKAGIGQ